MVSHMAGGNPVISGIIAASYGLHWQEARVESEPELGSMPRHSDVELWSSYQVEYLQLSMHFLKTLICINLIF